MTDLRALLGDDRYDDVGCGKYGTGRLVTPNPYRAPLPTPDALQATGDARSPRDATGPTDEQRATIRAALAEAQELRKTQGTP